MNKLYTLFKFSHLLFLTILIFSSGLVLAQDDICTDATPNLITIDCSSGVITETGSGATGPDAELTGSCLTGDVIWLAYEFDPAVLTFDFEGNGDYAFFEAADCADIPNNAPIADGCGGNPTLTDEPANTGSVYYVALEDGSDFTLTVTGGSSSTNDLCVDAEDLGELACNMADVDAAADPTACPDSEALGCVSLAGGGSGFGTWYTFTTAPTLTEFTITGGSFNLFEGPCSSLSLMDDCAIDGTPQIADPAITYFLLVDGNDSDVTIELATGPSNVDCPTRIPSLGGTYNNCCSATGEVWFEFIGDLDGTLLEFDAPPSSTLVVEIYEGPCTGTLLQTETGDFEFVGANDCVTDPFLMRVMTDPADCIEFDFIVLDNPCNGESEDICSSSAPGLELDIFTEACISGCTQFACSGVCGAENGVWFQVSFLAAGTGLEIDVNPADPSFGTPIISVYENDCVNGVQSCVMADELDFSIDATATYFIEIANTGVPGDFDLCMTLIEELQFCSEWSDVVPTRPENPDKDPDGPFCPGETVNFCSTVTFTIDPGGVGNDCQWLQGVIPAIGEGWDLAASNLAGQIPDPNFDGWWDDVEYSPHLPSTNPVYSLGMNANGLTLEFAQGGGLTTGDILPGGWYGLNPGGGTFCTDATHPNGAWGINGGCDNVYSFELCFDLVVRQFASIAECEDADLEIRLFTMADGMTGCWSNTTCAADIPGLYEDGLIDCSGFTELEEIDEKFICSGDLVDIVIETTDGSDTDIWVEPYEVGSVTGAQFHEPLSSGTNEGLLLDELENCETSLETVTYRAFARGPNCDGPPIMFDVIVFPKLTIDYDKPIEVCPDVVFTLAPIVNGGAGAPYEYEWRDDNNVNVGDGSSIDLPLPGQFPGDHGLTFKVTDSNGCTLEEIIDYTIVPPINEMIAGPLDICISTSQMGTQYCATHDPITDQDYQWIPSPGLFFTGDTDDEMCINIDEARTMQGTYTLRLEITDEYLCVHSEEINITIGNGPSLSIIPDGCAGADLQLIGVNSNHMNVPSTLWAVQPSGPPGTNGLPTVVLGDTIGGPSLIDSLLFSTTDFTNTIFLYGESSGGCTPPPVMYTIPTVVDPIFVPPVTPICEDESITLFITNFDQFNPTDSPAFWTDGNNVWNTGMVTEFPTMTTTYTFVGTNSLNCEVSQSFVVEVNQTPGAEILGSNSICANSTTVLTANPISGTGPYTYAWDDGTMTQDLSVSQEGDYFVTITDANNCSSTNSFNVQQGTSIMFPITFDPYCSDDPNGTIIRAPIYDSYQWYDDNGLIPGATDQTYATTVPGNYYVEIVDGSCSGQSDPLNVQGQDPLPQVTLTDEELCNDTGGNLDVSIDLTALIPPTLQGTWDEGGTQITTPTAYSALNKPADTYTLTFTTTNASDACDNYSIPLNIVVLDCGCPLQVATLPDQCAGAGDIDLNILTNEAGTWTSTDLTINGSTVTIDDSVLAGSYTLTFTHDATLPNNCTIDYGTTFEVFRPLAVTFNDADPVCNSTGTGQLTTLDLASLINMSSVPGSWSTLETDVTITGSTVDFNNAPVGNYSFTYTMPEQSPACGPGIFSVTVAAEDCNCPRVIIDPIPDQCNVGGLINLNSMDILQNPDGLPGVWTMDPDVGALLVDQIDLTGIPGATYTLTYTLAPSIDGCDAINMQSVDLVVSAVPNVMLQSTIEVCNGFIDGDPRPLELDLESLVTGDAGTWSAPMTYNNGVIDNVNEVNFEEIDPGEYIFDYTVTGEGVCDDQVFSIEVTVGSCNCPNFATNPTEYCNEDGVIDLDLIWQDPSEVGSGTWVGVNGATPFVVVGSLMNLENLDGRYFVSFTLDDLAAGCDPQEIVISVSSAPIPVIPPIIPACNVMSSLGDVCIDFISLPMGAAGTWTADPDYLLVQSFDNPADACFEDVPAGDYEFIFTVPNSNITCGPDDYPIIVSVSDCDCPNIQILDANNLCSGSSLLLSDLESNGIADGSWSVDNPGSVISNGEFIADAPGTYTLRYTPTDAQPMDCDDFTETTFDVIAPPFAGTAIPGGVCAGLDELITLSELLDGEDAGGVWSEAGTNPQSGGLDDIAGTFSTDGMASGVYEFNYTAPMADPCPSDEVVVTVELFGAPTADAGLPQTISCGQTAELGGVGTTLGQGVTYEWTVDNGTTLDDTSPRPSVNAPGTYTLTVTDMNGCTDSDEVVVTSDGGLTAEANPTDPPCFGQPGVLLVTSIGGGNDVEYSIDGENFQASEEFMNVSPGFYTLTAKDENGCEVTDTFSIVQPAELTVDAGEDRQVELGDSLYTLEAAISIDADRIASIIWTDQDGDTLCGPDVSCATIMVDPDIFNTYCVEVIDINDCPQTACVTLREQLVQDVYIPNVFSPSEDDPSNQTFHVHTDQFIESVNFLNIYDRWGELVYAAPKNHLPNMPEFGWNGRWNNSGNDVEPGVYVYVIEIQYVDTGNGAETEIFAGDITVYR